MKNSGVILIVFILCANSLGCATATKVKYENKLNSLLGSSSDTLRKSWGPPDKTDTLDNGNKTFEYTKYKIQRGAMLVPINTGKYSTVVNTPTSTELWCTTQFTIDSKERIIKWSFKGNDCKSE
jgi:hypothetical protein